MENAFSKKVAILSGCYLWGLVEAWERRKGNGGGWREEQSETVWKKIVGRDRIIQCGMFACPDDVNGECEQSLLDSS